jgi:hypothetical protein
MHHHPTTTVNHLRLLQMLLQYFNELNFRASLKTHPSVDGLMNTKKRETHNEEGMLFTFLFFIFCYVFNVFGVFRGSLYNMSYTGEFRRNLKLKIGRK